jgi:hypothetical protein
MLRPYRWLEAAYNHDDAMDVIGHDHVCVQLDMGKMAWNLLPARPRNLPECRQPYDAIDDIPCAEIGVFVPRFLPNSERSSESGVAW